MPDLNLDRIATQPDMGILGFIVMVIVVSLMFFVMIILMFFVMIILKIFVMIVIMTMGFQRTELYTLCGIHYAQPWLQGFYFWHQGILEFHTDGKPDLGL
jgi:hypothetical protein